MADKKLPLSFYLYHAIAREAGWKKADDLLREAVRMQRGEVTEEVVKYMTNLTHEMAKIKPIGEC